MPIKKIQKTVNMMKIDREFVSHLVAMQFPKWKDLPVWPVAKMGWDNKTFHLGEDMLVRLPSRAEYAVQVEKEHKWLGFLGPKLPFLIPEVIAMGEPSENYPWKWSIYRYIEGEPASTDLITNLSYFAKDLAQFLITLQSIDVIGGPSSGEHSFHRGGSLSNYDTDTRKAIGLLSNKIDTERATKVWENALMSKWINPPVWVHGDINAGNLLVKDGNLCAVIDFGQLNIGDPACDLAIAWTFFKGKSREVFYDSLPLDRNTWNRARGWALWKALIIASGLSKTNVMEVKHSCSIIDEVLSK